MAEITGGTSTASPGKPATGGGGGAVAAQVEELTKLGVNPALDNRTGDQRPQRGRLIPQQVAGPEIIAVGPVSGVRDFGIKPQQIPGPEVGHFAEHAAAARREHPEWFTTPAGDPLGMKSEGPHGRGLSDD